VSEYHTAGPGVGIDGRRPLAAATSTVQAASLEYGVASFSQNAVESEAAMHVQVRAAPGRRQAAWTL
jgi:hypothetical protein